MKLMKFILYLMATAQLSCVSENILELSWEEVVPTGVTKPKRYQIDTYVEDLYNELKKEAVVSHALSTLQPRIETLCVQGYTLLGSYISDKKIDQNSFNRWVFVKLTIQCNEPTYLSFKVQQYERSVASGTEAISKSVKAREEHQTLSDLTKKCQLAARKGETSDSCTRAAGLLESYAGPGVDDFRSAINTGLCLKAQKEQGVASIKKQCNSAFKSAILNNDTRNELLTAGILCMETLDGSACLDAAKRAELLGIKFKNARLSSRLFEKGVALLIEECNSKIQISCDKLGEASEECLSTPKFCRSIRLKLAPMLTARSLRDEEEKSRKSQAAYKEKIDQDYLSLQKAQIEIQQQSAEAQIDLEKSRINLEHRQLDIENQRELLRSIQSIFR